MHDIKSLLVFSAVLEHGSMHAAAAALGMTPSAVSQHITRLETVQRIKLLNRSTRSLSPTDAGRALADHCRRLQQALDDTRAALGRLKTETAGTLTIALTSSLIDAAAFQTALTRLNSEYPDIRPVFRFSDTLENLQTGDADIAIRGGGNALDDPNLVSRRLATWRWQICAAPAYLERRAPIERPEQLHGQSWLNYLPVRTTLSKGTESRFLDIADSTPCNQLAAVRTLTLQGFGLSLQLDGEVRHLTAAGRLKTVLPDWTLPSITLYLVTPYRVQSAKTEAAVRIFQESFAQEHGL